MLAWHGRALHVDLTSRQNSTLPLSSKLLRQTLGGRGLAGYLLKTRCPDLSSPAFCLAVGPFCGKGVPTADRLIAVYRSPLSGGVFDNSSGCGFAPALKSLGYDALLVTGSAAKLSCIELSATEVLVEQAGHLSRLETGEVFSTLKSSAALAIGPAGENQVRFASVVASVGEPLERGGLGALWGRMGLKSIVASPVESPSPDLVADSVAMADIERLWLASPYLSGPLGIGACGTAALMDLTRARKMLPVNCAQDSVAKETQQFSAAALKKRPGYRAAACPGCPIGCRKQDQDGPLPEYDSFGHFSTLTETTKLDDVIAADRRCRQLGMDPVSAAATLVAWRAVNADLSQGTILKLLEEIACRQGEGAELAEGSLRYLQQIGRPELSRCSKGLELPAFDPRRSWGMGLSIALSTSGDYHHAQAHFHELLRKPVPTEPLSLSGKARILVQAEDMIAATDSLCLCRHAVIASGNEEHAALLSELSGEKFLAAELAEAGRQTILRERWLNQKSGFTAKDDDLPDHFFTEGDSRIDRTLFLEERARYYRIRGLSSEGHIELEPKGSA